MRDIWEEIRANRAERNAEELVFRTFEQAVARIDLYEPKGEFFSWLYVIMLNFRRMDLRKNGPELVSVGTTADLPETADTLLADALAGVDAEGVRCALGEIPCILAEVLIMRFFEGWSLEEIATLAEIPAGTVKSRLHHAKAAFRKALEEGGFMGCGGVS